MNVKTFVYGVVEEFWLTALTPLKLTNWFLHLFSRAFSDRGFFGYLIAVWLAALMTLTCLDHGRFYPEPLVGDRSPKPDIQNVTSLSNSSSASSVRELISGCSTSALDFESTGFSRRLARIEQQFHSSFSFDPVGMPDFAQWSAGGRILREYTTIEADTTTQPRSVFPFSFPSRWPPAPAQIGIRGPEVAITAVLGLGDCWPINGTYGTLGVLLARTILLTAVTIEHAPKQVSFDLTSAPRDIEIWGVPAEAAAHTSSIDRSLGFPHGMIMVARVSYNIYSNEHIQTFYLDPTQSLVIGAVVVAIQSNWGNIDHTCLYRVRVHGNIYK